MGHGYPSTMGVGGALGGAWVGWGLGGAAEGVARVAGRSHEGAALIAQ